MGISALSKVTNITIGISDAKSVGTYTNLDCQMYIDGEFYKNYEPKTFTVKITKFGKVGDWVEGTFEGSIRNFESLQDFANPKFHTIKGEFKTIYQSAE